MASTYTDRNRFTKQGVGENESTWGTILNTVLDLVDESTDGVVEIDVSAADVTLTTNNGSSDQARNRTIRIVGDITSARTITIPDQEKNYLIEVATSGTGTVNIKNVSDNTGVDVSAASGNKVIICDGTSTREFLTQNTDVLVPSNNLSDLTNVSVARDNLGLGILAEASVSSNNILVGTNGSGIVSEITASIGVTVSSGTIKADIATSAEASAGTETEKLLTPSTLGSAITGAIGIREYAESSAFSITEAAGGSFTHGLSQTPVLVTSVIICQTSDAGYVPGEELDMGYGIITATNNDQYGYILASNTSTIDYKFAEGVALYTLNKSTGVREILTNSSWSLVIRAWA